MIINKLKRLILPSIIFSIVYFILFYTYKGFGSAVYSVINGCGHMWYLPMLFWCFVGGWVLEKVKIKNGWKLAFLIALNLFSVVPLPLQLSSSFSYLIYFYIGYLFYKYTDNIIVYISKRTLVIVWLVSIVLFVVLRPLRDVLAPSSYSSLALKVLVLVGNHACQFMYALPGVIAFYGTAYYYSTRHELSIATYKIAASCFGIYLFQQFVLQLLYYRTDFPLLTGPYWLPWCGFIITAVVSYILSSLLLKTKTGRFLIG